MSDTRSIGVFDSGLGGLTVVRAIRKLMPSERIVYLGDTARVPYGNRSPETVRKFALEDMDFLMKQGVKTILAACNTVSALALDAMQEKASNTHVGGVILPGAKAAAKLRPGRVLVLGTRGTVNSNAYADALKKIDPSITVESRACPLFVPIAEEGILNGKVTHAVFDLYLGNLFKTAMPDVLLLGCTHYPLLRQALEEYLPHGVTILDSAETCAGDLKSFLTENNMQSHGTTGENQFFVTDLTCDFKNQAERFLGHLPLNVEKAEL